MMSPTTSLGRPTFKGARSRRESPTACDNYTKPGALLRKETCRRAGLRELVADVREKVLDLAGEEHLRDEDGKCDYSDDECVLDHPLSLFVPPKDSHASHFYSLLGAAAGTRLGRFGVPVSQIRGLVTALRPRCGPLNAGRRSIAPRYWPNRLARRPVTPRPPRQRCSRAPGAPPPLRRRSASPSARPRVRRARPCSSDR